MTFRIDQVRHRNGTWLFDIKGIRGQEIYGTLLTDSQGKGLYLMTSEVPIPTASSKVTNCDLRSSPICSPDEFWIPAETSTTSAGRILAGALLRLGWGPEVDQHNRQMDAYATEFVTPFGAVTSMAKQASCDHNWQPDGQTLTSVRWTCTKCFKTQLW